jgi:hypothetical protein
MMGESGAWMIVWTLLIRRTNTAVCQQAIPLIVCIEKLCNEVVQTPDLAPDNRHTAEVCPSRQEQLSKQCRICRDTTVTSKTHIQSREKPPTFGTSAPPCVPRHVRLPNRAGICMVSKKHQDSRVSSKASGLGDPKCPKSWSRTRLVRWHGGVGFLDRGTRV